MANPDLERSEAALDNRWRRWPRPSPLEWVFVLVGAFLTLQQAWLLDDAFIYFRYADNLLFLDRGLAYNAGEYVEGYSSPLWMLVCIGARSIGLDWWAMVRIVGVLSWCSCAFLLIALQRRLHRALGLGANVPLAYLALSYPTLCYWTSGLEAPLVQLAAPLVALYLLQPNSRALPIALAGLILIRPELALTWIVCVLWSWLRTRRVPWGLLICSGAVVGSWLAFRVVYYAELLPNTFFLKDTESLAQGWRYLGQTLRVYWVVPFAVLATAVALYVWRRRGGVLHLPARLTMLLCALLQAAYVVKVGGDMMHHRFLIFSFVLAAIATAGIFEQLWSAARPGRRRAFEVAAALVAASAAALCYPPHLERNPLLGAPPSLPAQPVLVDGTNDAMSHRTHEDLRKSPWTLAPQLDLRDRYAAFVAAAGGARHERVLNEGWCHDAFLAFDAAIVHSWGLTDPILARLDLPWTRPAHRKGLDAFAQQLMYHRQFALSGQRELRFRDAQAKRQRLPDWVARNLDAIDVVEQKMYNRHNWRENLALALKFVGRYSPEP